MAAPRVNVPRPDGAPDADASGDMPVAFFATTTTRWTLPFSRPVATNGDETSNQDLAPIWAAFELERAGFVDANTSNDVAPRGVGHSSVSCVLPTSASIDATAGGASRAVTAGLAGPAPAPFSASTMIQ